ncbi:CHASE3 domain-containing protein [Archangium violaceum]|uniref:methyl-accepting chemotaxis protein n=1 Tax=Archangium violaceum TaxID=83451 RepID=UPI001950DB64|nr:methyl-accepting chemotaxis protein [Archangium violaceum]QRN96543.1 CHASE3 domain-containing protein [Archangium violaceum]
MFSKWTVGQQFRIGFLLVAALLGLFLLASFESTRDFATALTAVQRSHETLNGIDRVRARLDGAEMGLRGYIFTGSTSYLEPHSRAATELARELSLLRELVSSNPEQARRLEALQPLIERMLVQLRDTTELRRTQGFSAALATLDTGEGKRLMDGIHQTMEEMRRTEANQLAARDAYLAKGSRTLNWFFSGGSAGVLVFVTLIGVIIARSLGRKLENAIHQVQSSSAELQSAASQQATGAREQASASTEISTTVQELLSTSRIIATSAQQVARVADETAGAAHTGNETVQHAQEAIESVRRQVDAIVNHMLELGKRSQEIGGIVDIINELAEQTNILAINATIESAGAGEHGKRFAVVAEEIRKLADRVGGATKDIRVLIDEIRAASNTTIMATEDGSKAVQSSAKQFGDVAGNFRRIAELVRANLDVAREIELSTQQQTTAVEQVNTAIHEMAATARQTEASSTQTLQTANQLIQLSQQLNAIMAARVTR